MADPPAAVKPVISFITGFEYSIAYDALYSFADFMIVAFVVVGPSAHIVTDISSSLTVPELALFNCTVHEFDEAV